MKNLIIATVMILTFSTIGQAEDIYNVDVSAMYGYHIWSGSGHTFMASEKDDKEWNGNSSQIEATFWNDNLGFYGYYGEDDRIKEEMFENYFYGAKTSYMGVGVKVKHRFFSCVDGYIGAGINRTILENTITIKKKNKTKIKQEDLRCFGPDVVLGADWFPIESLPIYLTLNARYSWNKTNSDMFNETTFDAGGLRMFGGIGYRF